jgi:hypothetical protein
VEKGRRTTPGKKKKKKKIQRDKEISEEREKERV